MKKLIQLLAGICLLAAPVLAQSVGPISVTGTGCATIGTFDKSATVSIYVSGTWSGTIQPQGTIQGQTAFNLLVTPGASAIPQATITANGGYLVSVSGLSTFQVCGNSVTGTATVFLNASQGFSTLAAAGGSIAGSGLSITSAGTTAPSPLATAACPTGQGVWQYILKADGNYQDTSSLDVTTVTPPTTPAGTINNCWRTYWNNSGSAQNQMKNRFLGMIYSPGQGGVTSSATQQSSGIGVVWTNEFAGSSQDYDQESAVYAEFLLSGATSNFHGHAGGEVDGGVFRGSLNDSRTAVAGTAPSFITSFSSQVTRAGICAACMSTSSGRWVNYRAYTISSASGAVTANQEMNGFYADGAGNTGGGTGGLAYYGFQAATITNRFPQFNAGFYSNNFGTNAVDWNFYSAGVNSAGTAAGFNNFQGPTSMGGTAHAASAYQLDVLGAVKLKAGAGVRQLDLFGSTSGSCGLSTDATATTVTNTCIYAGTSATWSGGFTTYQGLTTAGYGVAPQVARVRAVSQVAAIGTTTLLATGSATADYLIVGTLYCDSTSAAATVSITISYTDSGSQAQTITPSAAACTALGSSSFALINSPIVAKNATNITYSTAIANTPTYDLRLDLYQLGSN